MYAHEKIMLHALKLAKKEGIPVHEIIGELGQAIHVLSGMDKRGIIGLYAELVQQEIDDGELPRHK